MSLTPFPQMPFSMSSSTDPVFPQPKLLSVADGMPLYVLRSDYHEAVRIDVVVEGGQWEQEKLLQALFTNRLLREGTHAHTSSQLAELLDYYGAWLELSVSAHHSFITLYTLRRFAGETCRLLAEMLADPVFPEERLSIIKANNKNQHLVNCRRGDVLSRRMLYSAIYGTGHPCGHFAETDDFEAVSRQDLERFHTAFYTQGHISVYLSGNVDDDVIKAASELRFTKASPSLCPPFQPLFASPSLHSQLSIPASPLRLKQPDAVQASVCMGRLMMDADSDDYFAMRVVSTLLGGYFGSRLMTLLREEKGYTYNIGADLLTNTRQVLFNVYCEALADKGDEVVDIVRSECRRLGTELVSEEELSTVRHYMEGELLRNYEGAFALVDASIFVHTLGLGSNHLERTLATLRTIDAPTIRDVAARWLDADTLVAAVVAP